MNRTQVIIAGLVGVAAITTAVAVGVAFAPGTAFGNGSQPSLLQTVPRALYEKYGLHLTQPQAASGPLLGMNEAEARAAAVALSPGSQVREAVLLNVEDDPPGSPPVSCLCWVVSTNPAGGIHLLQAGSGPMPRNDAEATAIAQRRSALLAVANTAYHLDVFDAKTGAWVYSTEGIDAP